MDEAAGDEPAEEAIMNSEQVASIVSVAAQVGTQREAWEAETARCHDAEAKLLETVIAQIPLASLRAISSRIRKAHHVTGLGTPEQHETNEYYAWRGLCIHDGREKLGTGNAGEWGGRSLYLTTDRNWIEVDWSGSWSKWQGASVGWEGGELSRGLGKEFVDDWGVTEILQSILDALTSQRDGNLTARTKDLQERTAKLAAIVALLQK